MSVKSLLLAGGALALASTSASAAFSFSTTRTSLGNGTDRVNFIVSEAAPTFTIGAVNITPTAVGSPNGLKFFVDDFEGPQVLPATAAGQTVGAFNPGDRLTFAGLLFSATSVVVPVPSEAGSDTLYRNGLPNYNVSSFFAGSPRSFNNSQLGGGLVIGSAVVPTGTPVNFTGNIDDDLESTNGTSPFNVTNGIPEPTSLAFVGIGAMGLMARRRRA